MDDNTGSPVTPNPTGPAGPVTPTDPKYGFGHPRSFGALILIVVGVVLFLDNLGIAPFDNLRAYWPLVLSAFGLSMLTRARGNCNIAWPWAMIVVGVLVTAGNLGYIHANWGNVWPVWIIAAGINMLGKRSGGPGWGGHGWGGYPWGGQRGGGPRRNRNWNRHHWGDPSSRFAPGGSKPDAGIFSASYLRQSAVFASVNQRVDSPNFEGADLQATFGELKLDLRGATITTPDRRAIVETNASFGAIKLRVPETWRVIVEGTAVFGAYEDKTVPPRPVAGVDPPTLVLQGNAAFGAVEVEN